MSESSASFLLQYEDSLTVFCTHKKTKQSNDTIKKPPPPSLSFITATHTYGHNLVSQPMKFAPSVMLAAFPSVTCSDKALRTVINQ